MEFMHLEPRVKKNHNIPIIKKKQRLVFWLDAQNFLPYYFYAFFY